MPITKVIASSKVQRLKQTARKLKREDSLTHTQALDVVAKQAGFNHWHHVTLSNNLIKPAEDAFNSGSVMAFDCKESEGVGDDTLIHDHLLAFVLRKNMFEIFANTIDEYDEENRPLKDTLTPQELNEYFSGDFEDYVFYRLSPNMSNRPLKEILTVIRQHSFWMPRHLWVKGAYVDTYHIPTEDEDGSLIGIRL
ncbi:plasmid-related protein [Vibrio alginolyticus]|uniref:plasmid-related protein n=1 Tax=Vibrio alginolyticus TaxID=663 RepID=UPI0022AA6CE2|nr:plasmid-related protein [Vibrio alginolyticus]MCZ2798978.1 plasmid-related protein [Vibrio alginolyticus]